MSLQSSVKSSLLSFRSEFNVMSVLTVPVSVTEEAGEDSGRGHFVTDKNAASLGFLLVVSGWRCRSAPSQGFKHVQSWTEF